MGVSEAGVMAQAASVGLQFIQNDWVISRIDNDGDIIMVLGRTTNHAGAANVDVLDSGFQIAIRSGYGLFKRI
jgi:hypothetical protein